MVDYGISSWKVRPWYIIIPKFKCCVKECAKDMNCLQTHVAVTIAFSFSKERAKRTSILLNASLCCRLARHSRNPMMTEKSWFKKFCIKIWISVVNSQGIEEARSLVMPVNEFLIKLVPYLLNYLLELILRNRWTIFYSLTRSFFCKNKVVIFDFPDRGNLNIS